MYSTNKKWWYVMKCPFHTLGILLWISLGMIYVTLVLCNPKTIYLYLVLMSYSISAFFVSLFAMLLRTTLINNSVTTDFFLVELSFYHLGGLGGKSKLV